MCMVLCGGKRILRKVFVALLCMCFQGLRKQQKLGGAHTNYSNYLLLNLNLNLMHAVVITTHRPRYYTSSYEQLNGWAEFRGA